MLSSTFHRGEIFADNIQVNGVGICPATSARNLGVIFDNHLTMDAHVRKVCCTAYFHLRKISSIRGALTQDSAVSLVHAFVSSRLDYCNSLLCGISKKSLHKLQRVQNMAARMITGTRKRDHITPVLKSLHWLPVEQRIKFKVLLMTFKALRGLAPSYIGDLLRLQRGQRQLRSATQTLLQVPKTRLKTAGDKSFAYQAASLWNQLPQSIRSSNTVPSFKCHIKTLLFKEYYT